MLKKRINLSSKNKILIKKSSIGDTWGSYANINRAKKYGWKPKTDINLGVEKTLNEIGKVDYLEEPSQLDVEKNTEEKSDELPNEIAVSYPGHSSLASDTENNIDRLEDCYYDDDLGWYFLVKWKFVLKYFL